MKLKRATKNPKITKRVKDGISVSFYVEREIFTALKMRAYSQGQSASDRIRKLILADVKTAEA